MEGFICIQHVEKLHNNVIESVKEEEKETEVVV